MEDDGEDNVEVLDVSLNERSRTAAVNSVILDYYKKFGAKRDLEQYFSLSTAQSEIRDPTSLFWRRMKTNSDTDSGEKQESSLELCRISIKCSVPEPTTSQLHNTRSSKSDSESPPIVTEEAPVDTSRHSDDDSVKSDGNHSQKSVDGTLDTSMNKPHSPTSSVTSQRKLEWDSLADVGYANESDRKTSASSLSTLERLALKQQYSNNDEVDIGTPTAHSTMMEPVKGKGKKGQLKKTTRIHKKDTDYVEVNVPHSSDNQNRPINVNLTKHISFNVEKDGGVTFQDVKPDKVSQEIEQIRIDKEIQTSLTKNKDNSATSEVPKLQQLYTNTVPVLINLNTLKRIKRKRKLRSARRKLKSKKKNEDKENIPIHDKSGEQVSEAESFEYMPGHMYNQNQMQEEGANNTAGNKSSLESIGAVTTDSSKGSKTSFTKDLKKNIHYLKSALKEHNDNPDLKKKLIKQIVEQLVTSKYQDDDSATDFLSGLSFNSKKLGLGDNNYTTTSTSDANNTNEKLKTPRPKKSILRVDKFNPNIVPSTSQSAPNLPIATNSEKLVSSKLIPFLSSNTESDSSKSKGSPVIDLKSSEELYKKYMEAVKKEEAYKKHLRDKEMFLKQKLVCSDSAAKIPIKPTESANSRLRDLIKDLTRNNYDDGSGDASKLEGGCNSNPDDAAKHNIMRQQRSHSVFTLSSGQSDASKKIKRKLESEMKKASKAGTSRDGENHCCCQNCSSHARPAVVCDSSVQVNIRQKCDVGSSTEIDCQAPTARTCGDRPDGDVKYVCLCSGKSVVLDTLPENILVYQCARVNAAIPECATSKTSTGSGQCCTRSAQRYSEPVRIMTASSSEMVTNKATASSQTNLALTSSSSSGRNRVENVKKESRYVHEYTRCIQTDICINPKISDPSLSDVHIFNAEECVKVVSEHLREITKPSRSDCCVEAEKIYSSERFEDDAISFASIGKREYENVNENASMRVNWNDDDRLPPCSSEPDVQNENYTIPIQGTNMTLMVKLGTKHDAAGDYGKNIIDRTEKSTCIDKRTVDTELCKSVQCQSTEVFDYVSEKPSTSSECMNERRKSSEKVNLCVINTCLTQGDYKCNTYPTKREQAVPDKPFLRACTDPELKVSCVQTEDIHQTDKQIQKNIIITKGADENVCCNKFTSESVLLIKNIYEEAAKDNACSPRSCSPKRAQSPPCSPKANSLKRCPSPKSSPRKCGPSPYQSPRKRDSPCKPSPRSRERSPGSTSPVSHCSQSGHLRRESCRTKCNCARPSPPRCDPSPRQSPRRSPCQSPTPKKETPTPRKDNSQASSPRRRSCSPNCAQSPRKENNTISKCLCGRSYNQKDTVCIKKSGQQCSPTRSQKCSHCTEAKSAQESSKIIEIINYGCSEKKQFSSAERSVKSTACSSKSKSSSTSNKCESVSKSCPSGKTLKDCDDNRECFQDGCPKKTGGKMNSCLEKCGALKRIVIRSAKLEKAKHSSSEEFIVRCGDPETQIEHERSNCKTCQCGAKSSEGSSSSKDIIFDSACSKDPILNVIQDITRRYSKKDVDKSNKKKCFREIVNVLNYLLDTDETDNARKVSTTSTGTQDDHPCCKPITKNKCSSSCKTVDKAIQFEKKYRIYNTCDSSDPAPTTDLPETSSDSAACKILSKIKKECEKYHSKRKCAHSSKRCEMSSATTVNCCHCNRVHHCACKYKCRGNKGKNVEKNKKKCVAYNLIIQTSESMMSDEPVRDKSALNDVVVKVPPKNKKIEQCGFKELSKKIAKKMAPANDYMQFQCQRSRSLPRDSEASSGDCSRMTQNTIRQYLEMNRPDFVENCSRRQNCLKMINECRPEGSASSPVRMVVVHAPERANNCDAYSGGCVMNNGCHVCPNPYDQVQNTVPTVEQVAPPTGNCCYCGCLNQTP